MPIPSRGCLARLALGCAIATLGAACATDPRRDGLSPREFSRVERIAIHMGGKQPRQPYQVLERIEGISCNLSRQPPNHPSHKVVTQYEALYDMKLEAADLGADAIVGVSCRRYAISQSCYTSIVCAGEAVRLDDGVGMDLPPAPMGALRAASLGTPTDAAFDGDPALYESLLGFTPDFLTEAQRARLGPIGVAVPARSPRRTVEEPLSGDDAVYHGAGLWFVQCAAQGGTIGLIVSPLCAAIGAGLGALSAESEQDVKTSRFAIRAALQDYYSHEALRDRMLRMARQSGAPPLTPQAAPLPEDQIERRGNAWRFDEHVDSVIEIGVEELLLPAWRSGATTNLPVPVSVRARVRVVRLEDSREIYNRSYGFVSDKKLFRQWGADDGAALRHALEVGFEQMAERIVEDLLLAYPLTPGFAFSGAQPGRRNYVIEPLNPPVHAYLHTGSASVPLVASLEPTFRWRTFPEEKVLQADFQGKLRALSALRYDLRIYRLDEPHGKASIVLEQNDIEDTEFRLTQPLAPGTKHIWSVRARFVLNTGERTSRWSGDWVGGGIKGFLFRTPD